MGARGRFPYIRIFPIKAALVTLFFAQTALSFNGEEFGAWTQYGQLQCNISKQGHIPGMTNDRIMPTPYGLRIVKYAISALIVSEAGSPYPMHIISYDTECNYSGASIYEFMEDGRPLAKYELDKSNEIASTVSLRPEVKSFAEIYSGAELDAVLAAQKETRIAVAVVDSGIDYNAKSVAHSIRRVEPIGFDSEFSDHSHPFDFSASGIQPHHGTMVASIIAKHPKEIEIIPIRRFSTEAGMEYANQRNARVVNMSFVSRKTSEKWYFEDLFSEYPNMLFVAAAGNDNNQDITEKNFYPAAVTAENLITVASVDADGSLSYFSNYSETAVHIAARGSNVSLKSVNDTTVVTQGTSFAAPIVSRVAARMLVINPSLTPKEIKRILMETGDKEPKLKGKVSCGCVVNEARAIMSVSSTSR